MRGLSCLKCYIYVDKPVNCVTKQPARQPSRGAACLLLTVSRYFFTKVGWQITWAKKQLLKERRSETKMRHRETDALVCTWNQIQNAQIHSKTRNVQGLSSLLTLKNVRFLRCPKKQLSWAPSGGWNINLGACWNSVCDIVFFLYSVSFYLSCKPLEEVVPWDGRCLITYGETRISLFIAHT